MALRLLQVPGLPGLTELVVILLIASLLVVPAVLIYRDAKRRDAPAPIAWAVAMFVAAWSLVGVLVVLVVYYAVAVRET